MKANKKVGKQRIILKFLVPYLLILLVPLIIGSVIYNQPVAVMEEDAIHNNMKILEMTKDILDVRLAEVESLVKQVGSDPHVVSFQQTTNPFAGANTIRLVEIRQRLFEYSLVNRFLLGYYLIYHNSDVVMSTNLIYKTQEFYGDYFSYDGIKSELWQNEFSSNEMKKYIPERQIQLNGKGHSAVTYIENIGNFNTDVGRTPASIMVLIDNMEMRKLLEGLNISDGGWAWISDREGQILSSIGDPISADVHAYFQQTQGVIEPSEQTGDNMITYTKSTKNGWTYAAAQPVHIVLDKVNFMQKMSLLILLMTLIFGGGAAAWLAYRNSRPLRRIMRNIHQKLEGEAVPSKDGYGMIDAAIDRLMDMNTTLREKVQEHMPMLRSAFYERLLKGEFQSQSDMEASMKHINIQLATGYYAVIIIKFGNNLSLHSQVELDQLDVQRVVVKECLWRNLAGSGFTHDVDTDQITVFLPCGSDDKAQCKTKVNDFIHGVHLELQRLSLPITIAVGGLYEALMEVSNAYGEARWALNFHQDPSRESVIWYDEMAKDHTGFYYSSEMESRLIHSIQAGERTNTDRVLHELYKQNFIDRHLPVYMVRLLLYALTGSLVKLINAISLEGTAEEPLLNELMNRTLNDASDYSETFGELQAAFLKLCEIADQRKESRNIKLKEQITQFIDREYASSDLSLDLLADRFNMSNKYLSEYFKEQNGINFYDYLVNVRMENAKQLLTHSSLKVNDIAIQVGYNSSNSFCRAFKRLHGISPAAFRDMDQAHAVLK